MKADIQDLKMELWLRNRNEGKIVWETKDKDLIPISKMGDDHLKNAIRMLERKEETLELLENYDLDIVI